MAHPAFSSAHTQLKNVYLTHFEIENSPSRKAGIDPESERLLRIYGCELIQDAGVLLDLYDIILKIQSPQVAIATAQTLFHRFYFTQSFLDQHVDTISMACIFLASKLEEVVRQLRSIVSVFCCIKFRRLSERVELETLGTGSKIPAPTKPCPVLDMSTMYFWELKQSIVKAERVILEKLGFNTHVEHPHKFLLNYLHVLQMKDNAELAQSSWNYMNDSLRTTVCVKFRPEVIASASIYMAAANLGIPLHEEPIPWWNLFDASQSEMDEICWSITQLYESPPTTDIHPDFLTRKIETRNYTQELSELVSKMTNRSDAGISRVP